MDCIFCKIIDGVIPSYKIYEDEDIFVMLDISQNTKGHTLILPKKHFQNIYELDPESSARIFKKVPEIAKALRDAFHPIGLNIVINTDQPLQSVMHFHIHLIPRYHEDGIVIHGENHQSEMNVESYNEILKQIKAKL